MTKAKSAQKVACLILDGWGINRPYHGNAVYLAQTPHFDELWASTSTALLQASGEFVGLPDGQMGNSEVGHMTIGAGRVIYQDLVKINKAIREKTFFTNPVLLEAIDHVKKNHSKLHIKGLYSPGGAHSHQDHIDALIKFAKDQGLTNDQIFIHLISDGRDTLPKEASKYLKHLEDYLAEVGVGQISTLCGRFYAMDRDHNWDRTDAAFNLMTKGEGNQVTVSASQAVTDSYQENITDEFIKPIKFLGKNVGLIETHDSVIFANFRTDRPRQLVERFLEQGPADLTYVTMTQYNPHYQVKVAYPEEELTQTLGEMVSQAGLKQLRIAETVKFPHVTFFLNGKKEDPFPNEDRQMIKTFSDINTDDEKPYMRAPEIKAGIIEAMTKGEVNLIMANFANGDMVGHSGNIPAAIIACQTVDQALGEIKATAAKTGYQLLIIADHGNCDQMRDEVTDETLTAHSLCPVPAIVVSEKYRQLTRKVGTLADVAPTILKMLGLDQPPSMTGQSLV